MEIRIYLQVSEGGTARLLKSGARSFILEITAHDGVNHSTAMLTVSFEPFFPPKKLLIQIHSNPSSGAELECPAQAILASVSEKWEFID